jgi:eukaryotic-like serine/threonine-protein kinase
VSELAEQLDVLLEPEREAVRVEQQLRQRQRASLRAFRLGAFALLGLAGAGAFVVYAKRETLRLANELSQARAMGAQHFNQIEVCNASYRSALHDVDKCKASWSKDKKLFEEQLDAQMKLCESGTELDCALEVKKVRDQGSAKLRACEEQFEKHEADDERLEAERSKQQRALVAERDDLQKLADKRAEEVKKLGEERARAAAELRAALEERDKLRAELAQAAKAAAGGGATVPAGSASPGAAGSPPAASSPPPTTPPAPSTTPPATPQVAPPATVPLPSPPPPSPQSIPGAGPESPHN